MTFTVTCTEACTVLLQKLPIESPPAKAEDTMINQSGWPGADEEDSVFKMPSTSPSLQRHSASKTSSPDTRVSRSRPGTASSPARGAGYVTAYE